MTHLAFGLLLVSSLLLFGFGLNLLYLSCSALRLPRIQPSAVPAVGTVMVCVQIPIYNERYVAGRVIDAACDLDWPRDLFQVQVLDDSDDETVGIVEAAVARWRSRGVAVTHVRRAVRTGYKAGALANGLTLTEAPYLAVFDADFVPPADFLRRVMVPFDDPAVGFVQARWGHLNEGYSFFTRLQALSIDFHFLVEQAVRCRKGFFTNFTGTAGAWRRAAVEDAGGWSSATLTEDLDLSYRAQLCGWKASVLEDLEVPEELPVTASAYRRQQARWATGSFQCAWRLLIPMLTSPLPVAVRLQAFIHLLSYLVPVLMLVQLACYPLLLIAREHHEPAGWIALLPAPISLVSLAPAVGFLIAQVRRGRSWRFGLLAPFTHLIGFGVSLTVVMALVRSLRPGGEFLRTPKYRIVRPGQEWWEGAYVLAWDPIVILELLIAVCAAVLAAMATLYDAWLIAVYAALLTGGMVFLSGLTLVQGLQVLAPRRPGAPQIWRPAVKALPVLGVFSVALLLLLLVSRIGDPFEDSYHHWLVAATLAETGHLRDPLFGMEDSWLPAYHLLAAGILKLAGLWQLGWLKAANMLLAVATLACVHRLAGSPGRGRLAVLLLALNPIFLLTASSVVVEPLLTACLWGAILAAESGRLRVAATLAVLACLTGTKAWLWMLAMGAVFGAEWLLARRAARPLPALAWALPALGVLLVLQAWFGFASHSVARAANEAGSATVRGSLSPLATGRLAGFLGYSVLGALPLVALAPLGLVAHVRSRDGGSLLRLAYLPALIYTGAVIVLVTAGVYTGSHRYLYPALPGLALLAATALDRPQTLVRLAVPAAAALSLVGFLPVFTSFAQANQGLMAAGRSARTVPGPLLTDSPVAAFASGKPPSQITGSQALPLDQGLALAWLQQRGVGSLVLEDIDYYRATHVFPALAGGGGQAPFQPLGNDSDYIVAGGKRVHAYTLPARAG